MAIQREPRGKKRLGPKWSYHLSYGKARRLGQKYDLIACEAILGRPIHKIYISAALRAAILDRQLMVSRRMSHGLYSG